MHINKTTFAIVSILLIAIGFGICYLANGFYTAKSTFSTSSYTTQFQKMSADSLFGIRQAVDSALEQKASSSIDTLEALGRLKDSLLSVIGGLHASMRIAEDRQARLQLDSAMSVAKDLVAEIRKVIMDGTLELLRPTNAALRSLIKDMKEKTEKLQNLATTIATLSDIVSTLTNVLSSPFLLPAAAVTPAT